MSIIKNKFYRRFLDENDMDKIDAVHIKDALQYVKGKHRHQGRALIILLYYSGARPNEVLRVKAGDVTREKGWVYVRMKASKGGLPRRISLQFKQELVKEFWKYSSGLPPTMFLFWNFQSSYIRTYTDKSGKERKYFQRGDKVYYFVKKWFKKVIDGSITPYVLRHNRFTRMADEGNTIKEIKDWKGAKSYQSVEAYLHFSKDSSEKIGKKIT